jgi:GNAT superfamily N-acetyltransferase
VLVAQAGDVVAGFIDVHVQRVVESEPYGEVGGLVVGAAHRGTGVGATLLEAAAAWARARGLERLWIRANLARVGPHEFYDAVGCRAVKDQRVYEYPL